MHDDNDYQISFDENYSDDPPTIPGVLECSIYEDEEYREVSRISLRELVALTMSDRTNGYDIVEDPDGRIARLGKELRRMADFIDAALAGGYKKAGALYPPYGSSGR